MKGSVSIGTVLNSWRAAIVATGLQRSQELRLPRNHNQHRLNTCADKHADADVRDGVMTALQLLTMVDVPEYGHI